MGEPEEYYRHGARWSRWLGSIGFAVVAILAVANVAALVYIGAPWPILLFAAGAGAIALVFSLRDARDSFTDARQYDELARSARSASITFANVDAPPLFVKGDHIRVNNRLAVVTEAQRHTLTFHYPTWYWRLWWAVQAGWRWLVSKARQLVIAALALLAACHEPTAPKLCHRVVSTRVPLISTGNDTIWAIVTVSDSVPCADSTKRAP